MRSIGRPREATVLVDSVRFPESLRWHDGSLWFTDLYTQQILRTDLEGNVRTVAELADTPSALGWTPDGHLLIVSANARHLLQLDDGELVIVADLSHLVEYPCNDMVVDAFGRAYITNMGFDFGNPEAQPQPGPILLVTPEGEGKVAADDLLFPNGMVITPDGGTLIVAESYGARLTAFDIAPDGALTSRRVWAQFGGRVDSAEGQVTPDGISLDADGALWVASPGTQDVMRVRMGGEVTDRIPLDTIPLACMLGGPERRTLFIATTESIDPSDADAVGRIETMEVDVPGAGVP